MITKYRIDIKDVIQKIYELEERIKRLEENSQDVPELIRSTLCSHGLIERCAEDE